MLIATTTLTGLIGLMLTLAALLRLGFVANFISTQVLTGFKAGIGFVIVLDQIPKLLGVHIAKQEFFHDLLNLAAQVPHFSMLTLIVALTTLVWCWPAWIDCGPNSPAPLVAVGGGIPAS